MLLPASTSERVLHLRLPYPPIVAARQAFGSSRASYAADLIRARVVLGQARAAFTTLEESRAQALQRLLLERQLAARVADRRLWAQYETAVALRNRAEQAVSRASVEQARGQRALAGAQEAKAPAEELTRGRSASVAATHQWSQAQSAYTAARIKADALWAAIQKSAPAPLRRRSLRRRRRSSSPRARCSSRSPSAASRSISFCCGPAIAARVLCESIPLH